MLDTYNETLDYYKKDLEQDTEKTTEELQAETIESLESLLKTETERLKYKIVQLKKLAVIEQSFSAFGILSYDEAKEKQEILNQYL